jgi:hypothetical protein
MPQITLADEKNRLEYGPETTSFPATESTRAGCIARNPGARGSVWRRRKAEDEPALERRQKDGFERFTGWAHQVFKYR